jgi:hypothetical protein
MRELSDKKEALRARWPNYWLLSKHETSSMDMLAVYLNGEGNPSGRPKGAFRTDQASSDIKEDRSNDTSLHAYDGL